MLHENCRDSRARFRNDTVVLVRGSRKLLVKQIQKSGSWACEKIEIAISSCVEVWQMLVKFHIFSQPHIVAFRTRDEIIYVNFLDNREENFCI